MTTTASAAVALAARGRRPYVYLKMRRFRWQPGRQGTGYRKLLLAQGRHWDLYILDYPPGTSIPTHTDPVPGRRHWRANLVLWGERTFRGDASIRIGPLVVFRPDITPHTVAQVTRRRVVLSFGVAILE